MPGVHTTFYLVTKARKSFARSGDQLGKMAIFSPAINPMMIFLNLVVASVMVHQRPWCNKCHEESAGSGARGIWNLAGEW